MTAEVTVATGTGGLGTDMVLNIGPQHPSTHGVLRLRLKLDGERVISAEPIIGYMHRGAEKLFEVRDYRQILVLTNRHDWLSAFSNELGAAMAVERLMGIEVPERAVWLRTALAELNRVLNHLMFLGSYPLEIGAITPVFYAFRERETLQAVMEEISGGRMHYMFNRVGGLKEEVPAGWTVARPRRDRPGREAPARPGQADPPQRHLHGPHRRRGRADRRPGRRLRRLRAGRPCLRPRLRPAPRRAVPGLRRSLDVPVVVRTAGDCHARFEVLLDQVYVSLDLARQCLDRVDQITGPVNVRLPKVVKAPEGHTYAWTENPLGINGYYLVSRGEKTPWRLKLRTASYANVQALSTLLPGLPGPRPHRHPRLDVLRRRRRRQVIRREAARV